ncbi:venom acid phosphatase Acph-1 [Drosophila eugracilis]|uniref:venom acid phosphatase Acph-1 n=1 Tax=Drosophila eugracilis TaxID=29029 RepID=UPI0007E65D4C|nr:venom acid phosphatase Acph-1 [Drosophila eugracilis]
MLKFLGLLLLVSCVLLVRGGVIEMEIEVPNEVTVGPEDVSKDSEEVHSPGNKGSNSTLKLVHVLFRHGPRTPVNTYPKDPYINETYEPYGWGALTNGAKVELYKIGKQLRKRYKDFLPSYYQPETIRAQSSESPRTLMSLQMVLAGLFPPENTPMEWNMMLNWQPIPIVMEPEETDVRIRMKAPCPRYDEAVLEVINLPEVKQLHAENSDLLKELTNLTGLNVTHAHDVTNIFISLLSEQTYGLELPSWTKDYYPEKMLPLAAKSYVYDAYTAELRKMKGGFFVEMLIKQMQDKISGKLQPQNRKMFLSCGHDWTITNVLSALNVWEAQMPRFSALIAFELHQKSDTGEYYLEIFFQNDPEKEPEQLQIPGCDKQCPIEKLLELTKDIIPDASYADLCKAKGTLEGAKISYH